jgi:hypothetical protein
MCADVPVRFPHPCAVSMRVQTALNTTINGAAPRGGGGGLYVSQAATDSQLLPSPGLAAIKFDGCQAMFGDEVGTPPSRLNVRLNAEDGLNTAAPGFRISVPAGECGAGAATFSQGAVSDGASALLLGCTRGCSCVSPLYAPLFFMQAPTCSESMACLPLSSSTASGAWWPPTAQALAAW